MVTCMISLFFFSSLVCFVLSWLYLVSCWVRVWLGLVFSSCLLLLSFELLAPLTTRASSLSLVSLSSCFLFLSSVSLTMTSGRNMFTYISRMVEAESSAAPVERDSSSSDAALEPQLPPSHVGESTPVLSPQKNKVQQAHD
jgi:hypothetical protein